MKHQQTEVVRSTGHVLVPSIRRFSDEEEDEDTTQSHEQKTARIQLNGRNMRGIHPAQLIDQLINQLISYLKFVSFFRNI